MILIGLVVFLAAMIQGLLGFGGALIAMPLLVGLVGIKTATPVFALIGTLATLLNTIRWHEQQRPAALAETLVQQPLHQRRDHRLGGRADRRAQHGADEPAAPRAQVGRESREAFQQGRHGQAQAIIGAAYNRPGEPFAR